MPCKEKERDGERLKSRAAAPCCYRAKGKNARSLENFILTFAPRCKIARDRNDPHDPRFRFFDDTDYFISAVLSVESQ